MGIFSYLYRNNNIRTNMSNIKIIRSVYKITRCHMEPAPLPGHSNLFASNVRRYDANGDMILTDADRKTDLTHLIGENDTIEIYDGKVFDLDKPIDKAWWEAIKHSKRIAQDRSQRDEHGNLVIDGDTKRYGNAEFYVETPGKEAKIKIDRKRKVNNALNYIFEDTSQGLYTKAKLIGGDMSGLPLDEVTQYLSELAEKTPDKIIELYTGTDMHLRILLADALNKNIIRYKNRQIYIYGEGTVLGGSEETVIMWMKLPNNKSIVDLIKSETYPEIYETPTVDSTETLEYEPVVTTPKPAGRARPTK